MFIASIILLVLSVGINIFFIRYIRWLLKSTHIASYKAEKVKDLLTAYIEQLNGIYQLEMYYGDETLEAMLKNTKIVVGLLENYIESFVVTESDNNDEKDDSDEEEGEDATK